MSLKKNINRYVRAVKVRVKKTPYGEIWQNSEYIEKKYEIMYGFRPLTMDYIKKYISEKKPKTTLEIGCGSGIWPVKFKELFQEYTGVDIGMPAIEYCRKKSDFEFIHGDFIKMNLGRKFDLVFSLAVIDLVYDPDAFLTNIVNHTKKYAVIVVARGYYPELKEHHLKWYNRMGANLNELSVSQIKETLKKSGLSENQFKITKQANGEEFTRKKRNVGDDRNFDAVINIEI